MFKFNIGSAVNGVDRMITPLQAGIALGELGFKGVTLAKIAQSSTETTYVITAERFVGYPTHKAAVYVVCEALQQDAIAYTVNGTGYLVGPKAADWGGEFKQEYFID